MDRCTGRAVRGAVVKSGVAAFFVYACIEEEGWGARVGLRELR